MYGHDQGRKIAGSIFFLNERLMFVNMVFGTKVSNFSIRGQNLYQELKMPVVH